MEYLDHIDGKPTFYLPPWQVSPITIRSGQVLTSPSSNHFISSVNLMSAKDLGFAKPTTLRCLLHRVVSSWHSCDIARVAGTLPLSVEERSRSGHHSNGCG
jgi:hypothetical protein